MSWWSVSHLPPQYLLCVHSFVSFFLKESTKKDRYPSRFGGIEDTFDLIFPPDKVADTSKGLMHLSLKVTSLLHRQYLKPLEEREEKRDAFVTLNR